MTVPSARIADCSCDLCVQSVRHAESVSPASEYHSPLDREQAAYAVVPVRLVPRVPLAS
jgi:hypothetical protein